MSSSHRTKQIGTLMVSIGIFLNIWKMRSIDTDFSQWKMLALTEAFWLEIMPFMYFGVLVSVGIGLIWKHGFSLVLLFAYIGFTLEELLLGHISDTAVPFSTVSQWGLYSTVLLSLFALSLLQKEGGKQGKKYSFRALLFGIMLGVATSFFFSFWL